MNRHALLASFFLVAGCGVGPAATQQVTVAPTAAAPSSSTTPSATSTGTPRSTVTPTATLESTANPDPTATPTVTPAPSYAPPTTLADGVVSIQIPARPVILIPGDDGVWATTQRAAVHDVLAIDPETNIWRTVVAGLPAHRDPLHGMGVNDSVWLTGWDSDAATEYDGETGEELAIHPVGSDPVEPAYREGDVWVLNHHGNSISRIDARTKEIVATIDLPSPMHPLVMVSGDGLLWVAGPVTTEVHAIDPETNEVVRTIPAGSDCVIGVAYLGNRVWLTRCSGEITVHDPVSGEIVGQVDAEAAVDYISTAALVDGQRVWLPSFKDSQKGSVGRLVAIDVETLEMVAEYELPQQQKPWQPVAAFDSTWIDSPDGTLLRVPLSTLHGIP